MCSRFADSFFCPVFCALFLQLIVMLYWLQVCDQPHPLHVKNMVKNVLDGKFDEACSALKQLYDLGYSPTDIITTLFRVIKNYDMAEYLKLELLKVTLQPIKVQPMQTNYRSFLQLNKNIMFISLGNRICSHENLRWCWLISSIIRPSGKVCVGERNSKSIMNLLQMVIAVRATVLAR